MQGTGASKRVSPLHLTRWPSLFILSFIGAAKLLKISNNLFILLSNLLFNLFFFDLLNVLINEKGPEI